MFRVGNLLESDVSRLLEVALKTQGKRAVDNPRSAALVHEAGHAVLYTAYGYPVRSVKVWMKKRGVQRGHWVGFTDSTLTLKSGPDIAPLDEFKYATIVLAGVMAEWLYDHQNFRMGSSLDEVATARALARNIALKTGSSFEQAMASVADATASTLRTHELVVLAIASKLQARKLLSGSTLHDALASVTSLSHFEGGY